MVMSGEAAFQSISGGGPNRRYDEGAAIVVFSLFFFFSLSPLLQVGSTRAPATQQQIKRRAQRPDDDFPLSPFGVRQRALHGSTRGDDACGRPFFSFLSFC